MRTRQTNLIAVLTALFVLMAPLCAVACSPSAEVAPASEMAGMPHGDAPCHGPEEAPERPQSHDDCGCDEAGSAVFVSPEKPLSIGQLLAVLPHAPFVGAHALHRSAAGDELLETDLPPPDILLLKSTWLL